MMRPAVTELRTSATEDQMAVGGRRSANIAALTESELPHVEKKAVLGADRVGHQLLGAAVR